MATRKPLVATATGGLQELSAADTLLVAGNAQVVGTQTAASFVGPLTGNAATATTAGNVTGTVAIANGGTGQTTPAAALAALGGVGNGSTPAFNIVGALIQVGATQWQNQGTWIGWNTTGGGGEADFYSSHGSGAGGFNFYNVASLSGATPVKLAGLDAAGNFTATTFTGALVGNATTATTAGNVSGTVAIANGGTGQGTAAAALTALGAVPAAGGTLTGALNIALPGGAGVQTRYNNGTYSVLPYVDSNSFYMLLTDSGSPLGGFNNLRPFSINLSSGFLTMSCGVAINGGLTADSVAATYSITSGTNTLTGVFFLNGPAGAARTLAVRTAGANRWQLGGTADTESTGNAGTNFAIYRYDDTGAYIGPAFQILRSSGNATFYGTVTAPTFIGALTGNATTAGNVTGTVALANGGTGATSAAGALAAIGGFPASGGALNGRLTVNVNLGSMPTSAGTSGSATMGWNATGGGGEFAVINDYYAAGASFLWFQRTSTSVTNQVMQLNPDGSLYLGAAKAQVATQAYVAATYAPIASPTFTGTVTAGGGVLALTNATSNMVLFSGGGIAPPAITTRSLGTRLTLYPAISGSSVDYAVGVDTSTLWLSVPTSTAAFKFYAGTGVVGTLDGSGNLSVSGGVTAGATTLSSLTVTGSSTIPGYLTTAAATSTYQTAAQVNTAIQAVVGAAPAALDTLQEIAAQLQSDESAASALTTAVAGKLPLAGGTLTGGLTGTTATFTGALNGAGASFSSGVTALQLTTAATGSTSLVSNVTNGGTDAKQSDILNTSGTTAFRFVNDAFSAATAWLQANRTGYAVTSVTITAPTINLTGAVTVGGLTTLNGGASVTGAVTFDATAGTKLALFGTSCGIGITASELTSWSNGIWAFRAGAYTGTIVASISAAGVGNFTGLSISGALTANGVITIAANIGSGLPGQAATSGNGSLAWNLLAGAGEVDLINNYWGATVSLLVTQRTGASTSNKVLQLNPDGALFLGAGLAQVATQSWVLVNYAKSDSSILTGTTSIGFEQSNYVTVAGAASGTGPLIAATGSDANVPLQLAGKGTGGVGVTGPLTAAGIATTGSNTVTGGLVINGASGSQRVTSFQTAGSNRWRFGINNAEGGGNTGADWGLDSFNDAGVQLATPFYCTRATGVMTFAVSPVAPTAAVNTATTQLATTAFVANQGYAPLAPSMGNIGRNMLDNARFRVNQRGQASVTASGGYVADRWCHVDGAGTGSRTLTLVATVDADRATFGDEDIPWVCQIVTAAGSAASDFEVLSHRIEGVRRHSSKSLVWSFWAKSTIAAKPLAVEFTQNFGTGGSPSPVVTGIGVTKLSLTTGWVKYTGTVSVTSTTGKILGTAGNDFFEFVLWTSGGATYNSRSGTIGEQGSTISVTALQLEIGTVASPLEKPDYKTEQGECERYYQTQSSINTVYAGASGQIIYTPIFFSTRMRGAPTVVVTPSGGTGYSAVIPTAANTGSVVMQATSNVAGQVAYNFTLTASAEL